MPLLQAVRSDGTLDDISEEQLYRYTRNRWLYNESVQLGESYLKFDFQQLLKAAVSAVSNEGARYCTRVLKCREGLNNKAYILTMDNGSELFAKLPNPIAGPAFYTTASEVATRQFLRDALNIPTPRIIAWCADRNNPVGAEYILEEKAPGRPLGSLWYQWPMHSRLDIIRQIVDIEQKLAATTFTKSGCIYFKGDVPANLSSDLEVPTGVQIHSSVLEPFEIGPLVSTELWHGKRAGMNMHRGPYNEPLEFVEAMAANEKLYITTHARPRMNYHRSLTESELPDEVLDLLNRYLRLSPAMVPPLGTVDTHSPTLWHPDLHLDNVFVDPDSKKITRIIDWQSASVKPFFYQCGVARMFLCPWTIANENTIPKLPDNYDTLEADERKKIEGDHKTEASYVCYKGLTCRENPRHWAALRLQQQGLEVRTQPSRLVVRVWEDHDVFFLQRALLEIIGQWEDLCPDAGPCPVSFTEQELKLHEIEEDSLSDAAEIMRLFRDNWGLPADGMVEPGRFDEIRTAVDELRDSFIAGAEEDAEKAAKIWPYQDRDTDG